MDAILLATDLANSLISECNVRGNNFDMESANVLAKIGTEKGIMLFGIKRDQKEADFRNQGLGPVDAILLATDLVTGGLTKLSLAANKLGEEGTKAICEALQHNKTLKELDISGNRHGNIGGSAGAKHVAKMLGVNGALTRVDVRKNYIAGDGAEQLSAAVLGNLKIEMFNGIPIKEMRANSLTELDLNGKGVGVEVCMVVAGLIPVMGGLTVANLLGNQLDVKSAKMLVEAAKKKDISLCGIQRDQTTADFSNQCLGPVDAILLATDLVTGAL